MKAMQSATRVHWSDVNVWNVWVKKSTPPWFYDIFCQTVGSF